MSHMQDQLDYFVGNYKIHIIDNYFNFHGFEDRKEFWLFYLADNLVMVILSLRLILDYFAGVDLTMVKFSFMQQFSVWATLIYFLATIAPRFAAMARRLRDSNLHGMLCLFSAFPYINLIMLALCLRQSVPAPRNQYKVIANKLPKSHNPRRF